MPDFSGKDSNLTSPSIRQCRSLNSIYKWPPFTLSAGYSVKEECVARPASSKANVDFYPVIAYHYGWIKGK